MARPQKAVVDYFPHMVKRGKTILALESRFGNDGYAFWFKLLEILGETENHFFDCNNPANMEYMLAITKITEETASNILDLLAKVDAIDRDLWQEKIVWSQNFVDGVKDAYKRRKIGIPEKPSLCKQKSTLPEVIADINTTPTPDNANINPQSKVNKTKVNKSIIYTPDFETFWKEYPRPKQKEKTFELWNYFLSIGMSAENLIDAAKGYAEECLRLKTEEKYIKYSTTFLSKKGKPFIDYLGGSNERASGNPQPNNRESQGELDRIDFGKFEYKG